MSTVADLAIEALRQLGITQLFCVPGVQNDDFFDRLVDARDLTPVVTRHEQGAAYMALGAAQVSGRPAACCVVPGPGMLNAAAALSSAYWAGGRVLALVGAIPHGLKGRGIGVLHELPDPTAVLDQLTTRAEYVATGETAVAQVQAALDTLLANEARPVSIEIPVSAWNDQVDGELTTPQQQVPAIDSSQVQQAAELLAAAARPLIVVGSGAYDAPDEVRQLAEALDAPVFTRRQGHGVLDARHPLAVPLPLAHDLWARADVVLGIGTRMEFPIMHWGTDDDLTIIQLNIDEAELDRHGLGTIGIHGDAAAGAAGLLSALSAIGPGPGPGAVPAWHPDRWPELAAHKEEMAAELARLEPQASILAAIRRVLPDNGVIVEDVTQLGFAAHFAFEFRHPRTFLTTGPAGTLGAGVAQAIGAQAAAPDRPVLCLAGDGGFLFTAAELATAVQYQIPVTVLLHDNAAYGNVKLIQQKRFGPDRTIASSLTNPDFVALGHSFGLHTQRADSAAELEPALAAALAHQGPSLVVGDFGPTADPWPYMVMPRNRGQG